MVESKSPRLRFSSPRLCGTLGFVHALLQRRSIIGFVQEIPPVLGPFDISVISQKKMCGADTLSAVFGLDLVRQKSPFACEEIAECITSGDWVGRRRGRLDRGVTDSRALLMAGLAGWIELLKPHLRHNFLECGALAEGIKARILGQGEELHVSLPASSVEPFHRLVGFAQCGVGRGDIVGRQTLAGASTFETVQNIAGGGLVAGNRVGVCLHGLYAIAPAGQLDGGLKFPQRSLEVACLFQRLGHVHVRPNEMRIQLQGALIVSDRFIKLVRQVRRNPSPDQVMIETGSISRACMMAMWAASCCPRAVSRLAYQ